MKQVFIGVVGYQGSGKTTFCNKVLTKFPDLNHIRTDGIRKFLIKNYAYYKDVKYSYLSPEINSANVSVKKLALSLIEELIKNKQSIIFDSIGGKREKRKDYFNLVDKIGSNVTKVIVFIDTEKEIVINRLKKRDLENPGNKWEESFVTRWSLEFQKPKLNDADYLFVVKNGNDADVISKLSSILS